MNIDKFLSQIKQTKILSQRNLSLVCQKVKEILLEQSNIQPLSSPINICGNVAGQFYDLLELFEIGGQLSQDRNKKYVFMGGFTNKGFHSVQTFQYLICLKVKYPDQIALLRGNHQSRQMSQVFGIYDQIQRKYGNPFPWKLICQVFDYFPLGAIVDQKIFCVHGGLSPQLKTMNQIRLLDRKVQIPLEGPITDLMWSDPSLQVLDWGISHRGAGFKFGPVVVQAFNYINNLQFIARGHEMQMNGYGYPFSQENEDKRFCIRNQQQQQKYKQKQKNQSIVTVWSVPNYAYRCGNLAAILQINQNLQKEFITFQTVPQSSKISHSRNNFPYFV